MLRSDMSMTLAPAAFFFVSFSGCGNSTRGQHAPSSPASQAAAADAGAEPSGDASQAASDAPVASPDEAKPEGAALAAAGLSEAERTAQEDDIRQAVFLYQFKNYPPDIQEKGKATEFKIYFISLGTRTAEIDPDDDFMARFEKNYPPVKKVSACKKSPWGAKDKKTKKQGLIFRVGKITWISDGEVEVEGDFFVRGLYASGHIYRLQKGSDGWTILSDKVTWIS